MTLKTWKKEFYSKKPTKKMTKLEAIEHSLTKWNGLLKANLQKHDVEIDYLSVIDYGRGRLEINADSCALCVKYYNAKADEDSDECDECPLYQVNGNKSCGDGSMSAPHTKFLYTSNPKPMIGLLKKALKIEMGEKH